MLHSLDCVCEACLNTHVDTHREALTRKTEVTFCSEYGGAEYYVQKDGWTAYCQPEFEEDAAATTERWRRDVILATCDLFDAEDARYGNFTAEVSTACGPSETAGRMVQHCLTIIELAKAGIITKKD